MITVVRSFQVGSGETAATVKRHQRAQLSPAPAGYHPLGKLFSTRVAASRKASTTRRQHSGYLRCCGSCGRVALQRNNSTRQVDALQQHVQGIGTHAGDKLILGSSLGSIWFSGELSICQVLVLGEEVEICTPSSTSVPG
jgi:hypothetical protein